MYQTPHSYIDTVEINFKTKFYNNKGDYDDTENFVIKIYISDATTYTWTFDSGSIQADHWYEYTWTHYAGGVISKINDGEYINKVEIRVDSHEKYFSSSYLYIDYINVNYIVNMDS
jgi:hypothetical protein